MDWKSKIQALKEKKPSKELKQAILDAVYSRYTEDSGVLLSGGVDSSLIALLIKQKYRYVKCYSVGIENSADLEEAKRISEIHEFDLKTKVLTLEEVEYLLKELAPLFRDLKDHNLAVLYGVAAVELAASKIAVKDGIKHLFGGLGSEEVFAGYQRHVDAENIQEECWTGLINMYERDIIRDSRVAEHLGIEFLAPLLDDEVILAGMAISGKDKIKNGLTKYCLREIALELGLDKETALRPKKAAQYGSRIDKAIARLTKKTGFAKKGTYLESLQSKK